MERKTALITGIHGQDAAFLARELLSKDFRVIGLSSSGPEAGFRLRELNIHLHPNLFCMRFDSSNQSTVHDLIGDTKPSYVFNLASHSVVHGPQNLSKDNLIKSFLGVSNFLHAISKLSPGTRFFQAGSSEMFGDTDESPQSEESKFKPSNAYGHSKLEAHQAILQYRNDFGVFGSDAIMYNHESPLRSPEFVTRKISLSVARIKFGLDDSLKIGNLSAIRDWGYAPEYVDGMIRIIQYANPETFILASGRAATVRDFVRIAFEVIGVAMSFEGSGLEEVGFDSHSGRELVAVDPRFFRPAEETPLVGNPAKAKSLLGWEPLASLEEIVRMMVSSDLASLSDLGAR